MEILNDNKEIESYYEKDSRLSYLKNSKISESTKKLNSNNNRKLIKTEYHDMNVSQIDRKYGKEEIENLNPELVKSYIFEKIVDEVEIKGESKEIKRSTIKFEDINPKIVKLIEEVPIFVKKYVDYEIEVEKEIPIKKIIKKEEIVKKVVKRPIKKIIPVECNKKIKMPIKKIYEEFYEVEKIVEVPNLIEEIYEIPNYIENIIYKDNIIEVNESQLSKYKDYELVGSNTLENNDNTNSDIKSFRFKKYNTNKLNSTPSNNIIHETQKTINKNIANIELNKLNLNYTKNQINISNPIVNKIQRIENYEIPKFVENHKEFIFNKKIFNIKEKVKNIELKNTIKTITEVPNFKEINKNIDVNKIIEKPIIINKEITTTFDKEIFIPKKVQKIIIKDVVKEVNHEVEIPYEVEIEVPKFINQNINKNKEIIYNKYQWNNLTEKIDILESNRIGDLIKNLDSNIIIEKKKNSENLIQNKILTENLFHLHSKIKKYPKIANLLKIKENYRYKLKNLNIIKDKLLKSLNTNKTYINYEIVNTNENNYNSLKEKLKKLVIENNELIKFII